jgi:hypothetical protein
MCVVHVNKLSCDSTPSEWILQAVSLFHKHTRVPKSIGQIEICNRKETGCRRHQVVLKMSLLRSLSCKLLCEAWTRHYVIGYIGEVEVEPVAYVGIYLEKSLHERTELYCYNNSGRFSPHCSCCSRLFQIETYVYPSQCSMLSGGIKLLFRHNLAVRTEISRLPSPTLPLLPVQAKC